MSFLHSISALVGNFPYLCSMEILNIKDDEHKTQMAFWNIEEPLSFFSSHLKNISIPEYKSERRKLEFAATRFLLQELVSDFPFHAIEKNEKGKPYIKDNPFYFSISHTFPYVGVAISEEQSIGLDLQIYERKISRLQDKFLGKKEQELSQSEIEKITLLWSGKEAAYKWYGEGFMDFKEHMQFIDWKEEMDYIRLIMDFNHPEMQKKLQLQGKMEKDFAWASTTIFKL